MTSIENIKKEYPLHYSVWENDFKTLEDDLKMQKDSITVDTNNYYIEKLDPRGRTPLMMAVKLSHIQCVKILLSFKANANFESEGWSVVQEAVCTGDFELLNAVLGHRDLQRHQTRVAHVPELLEKLKNTPDFYVELLWEFSSWLPLVSKMCPSDVYKVYKRGSNVRIDTTLIGFDTTWQRGNRSYVFKGMSDHAVMLELDHDEKEYTMEMMRNIDADADYLDGIPPTKESVQMRLKGPVIANNIDMDKISFERNKSGFWGWRTEKNETINNYDCRVFGASNVEFVTRTRTEHLNGDASRVKNSRTPLQHFLGIAEDDYDHSSPTEAVGNSSSPFLLAPQEDMPKSNNTNQVEENASAIPMEAPTIEEYFSDQDLQGRDIGRPKKISTKVQKFKANLWLSDEFPIKLQEQVLPILDLMSSLASPHVSKLRDFITVSLPSGFPVKVEIPLFHVLNAIITFQNVFSLDTSVNYVSNIKEEGNEERLTCIIDDECFDLPPNYINRAHHRRQAGFEDEDQLVQYAIQQSLIEQGTENDEVDIWEALRAQRPVTPNNYLMDEDLQRALQESLLTAGAPHNPLDGGESNGFLLNNNRAITSDYDIDENLELAIKMSQEEERIRQQNLQKEQELLEQILKLSLEEK